MDKTTNIFHGKKTMATFRSLGAMVAAGAITLTLGIGVPAQAQGVLTASAPGWAEDIPYNYGRRNLIDTDPAVAKLIINSNLSNEEQADMILAIDVDGRDMAEMVQEGVEANEAIWRKWLDGSS
jgi:hypothetical protein